MATIVRTKRDESLTVLTVSGALTRDEILHAFEEFVGRDATPHLLWDFSDADLSGLTREDLEHIVAATIPYAHLRPDGKTALLVPLDLSYGISRMYETYSGIEDHPIDIKAFRSLQEALAWL